MKFCYNDREKTYIFWNDALNKTGYVNIRLFCQNAAKLALFSRRICRNMKFSHNWNFEMCDIFYIHYINTRLFFRNFSLYTIVVAKMKQFLSYDF